MQDVTATMSRQSALKTGRDAYFDNVKSILIFLVVFAHLLELVLWKHSIYTRVYSLIYSFHMPLFVFISGYFSKNADKARSGALRILLPAYLVFNVFYGLLLTRSLRVTVFTPYFAYWFLLSLFSWRLMLKDLLKLRFILPLALLVSLYAGLFGEVNRFLSLSRTLYFLPFFLAGYFFNERCLAKLRKVPLPLALLCFFAGAVAIYLLLNAKLLTPSLMYGADSYAVLGFAHSYLGMLSRLILYAVSAFMCLAVLRLIPRRKMYITRFGAATMPIFLLHPLVRYFLELNFTKLGFLSSLSPPLVLLILSAASVLLLLLFGNRLVMRLYSGTMSLLDRAIFKDKE